MSRVVLVDGTTALYYISNDTQNCNTSWCLIRDVERDLGALKTMYYNTFLILICIIIHGLLYCLLFLILTHYLFPSIICHNHICNVLHFYFYLYYNTFIFHI